MVTVNPDLIDDDVVDAYSGQDSLLLADALAALTGWPLVFCAADPQSPAMAARDADDRVVWAQAGVEAPDEQILDVAGLVDAERWLEAWGESVDVWMDDVDRNNGYTGDEATVVRAADLGYTVGSYFAAAEPQTRAVAVELAERIVNDPLIVSRYGALRRRATRD